MRSTAFCETVARPAHFPSLAHPGCVSAVRISPTAVTSQGQGGIDIGKTHSPPGQQMRIRKLLACQPCMCSCALRFFREGSVARLCMYSWHDPSPPRIWFPWGPGTGGDGGDGGNVKQQTVTDQTGDGNSGKTALLDLLPARPAAGGIEFAWLLISKCCEPGRCPNYSTLFAATTTQSADANGGSGGAGV